MFCPKCKTEFETEIEECPDCGVPLVETLPPDLDSPEEEMIPVFETTDASLLPVIKSVLDSAGISYVIQGDEAFSLFPIGGFSSSAGKHGFSAIVHVPARQLEEAKAVIDSFNQGESSEGDRE